MRRSIKRASASGVDGVGFMYFHTGMVFFKLGFSLVYAASFED